jgi:hypothetical protein
VDWQTLVFDGTDRALTAWVVAALRTTVKNPTIGRRLYSLFNEIGLMDVAVTPHTFVQTDLRIARDWALLSGAIDDAKKRALLSASEAASLAGFIIVGRKP